MPAINQLHDTAVVQGASRGIGLALIKQLLDDSHWRYIWATSRHASTCAELLELQQQDSRLVLVDCDITDEKSIAKLAEQVQQQTQHLGLLINAAGLLHTDSVRPEKRLQDIKQANLQAVFSVNAFGPILLASALAKTLQAKTAQHTVIANISARVGSIGDNGLGGWYGYRAAKAAQNMLTKTLSIELQRRNPQAICLALHPGTTDTDLSAPFNGNTPAEKLFSPERAAQQLLTVISNATVADNGAFLAWDGSAIEW